MQVLDWMKQDKGIRADRILVSGFSLGTEPLMVLGVLDKSIYGFVYNDFLCQTQERACVMTRPSANGYRPFPNSIRHLIPNFWKYFNFPDRWPAWRRVRSSSPRADWTATWTWCGPPTG